MLTRLILILLLCTSSLAWSQDDAAMTEAELQRFEQQLAEAQAQIERAAEQLRQTNVEALRQAELAREKAELEQERALSEEQRAELASERAQINERLREARREIQRAGRDLARAQREIERERIHQIRVERSDNRGVIGLLLGQANEDGIVVTGVTPNGPADNQGLHEQDRLIGINGARLTATDDPMQQLRDSMQSVKPGDTVSVTVMRDEESMEFDLEAEERRPMAFAWTPDVPFPPDMDINIDVEEIKQMIRDVPLPDMPRALAFEFEGEEGNFELHELSALGHHALEDVNLWFGPSLTRGLSFTDLNPELGRYFGADNGVLVTEAEQNNAWDLQAGDVITSVNGLSISNTRDLVRSIRDTDRGEEVRIQVLRDGSERQMSATVPEAETIGQLLRNAVPQAMVAPPANLRPPIPERSISAPAAPPAPQPAAPAQL